LLHHVTRKGCKTTPFLPSCLPVGLISHVPFVLLLPGTQTFGFYYVRYRRRSPIKSVWGTMIVVVILHYKRCENLWNNKEMPRGVEVSIICHSALFFHVQRP
jgi:hypothetical protein